MSLLTRRLYFQESPPVSSTAGGGEETNQNRRKHYKCYYSRVTPCCMNSLYTINSGDTGNQSDPARSMLCGTGQLSLFSTSLEHAFVNCQSAGPDKSQHLDLAPASLGALLPKLSGSSSHIASSSSVRRK